MTILFWHKQSSGCQSRGSWVLVRIKSRSLRLVRPIIPARCASQIFFDGFHNKGYQPLWMSRVEVGWLGGSFLGVDQSCSKCHGERCARGEQVGLPGKVGKLMEGNRTSIKA